VRVGKVVNKYKVGKHFKLDIQDDRFGFEIDQEKVLAEAALDGIYVIRTSLSEQRMGADDTVRSYKRLVQVERAFRSLKTLDLKVRPIRHRLENRVRAHIFLCMLAHYVQWNMLEAWRPLLFCDEDQEAKAKRDPVAPAKRSKAALRKVHSKTLDDGSAAHSFQTLLKVLSSIVRNICHVPGAGPDDPTFEVVTTPNAKQQRAYDLLGRLPQVVPRGHHRPVRPGVLDQQDIAGLVEACEVVDGVPRSVQRGSQEGVHAGGHADEVDATLSAYLVHGCEKHARFADDVTAGLEP